MIRSMTGFARRESQTQWGGLVWELRCVNHRYLDISWRLPDEFRSQETRFQQLCATHIGRGKLTASLRFEPADAARGELQLNTGLVRRLQTAADELATITGADTPLTAAEVLRWPGVVNEQTPDMAPVFDAASAVLDDTLKELAATRAAEGERIATMIRERSQQITALVHTLRGRIPEILAQLREKFVNRLADLNVTADPQRLEQELAIVAQKLDVAEELDRLDSHIVELNDCLQATNPIGRKLDFLMQEFNREANTLGSKLQDTETTRAAIEMKVLIEQMREQIQNIE
ncbi:MAG TPA: YicC/YloC family endoribonuclease [Gammaproteobacteria bacterium]|nr:YicC/YloC family endoribonuclease [Gammaproteobacteria bacterium]